MAGPPPLRPRARAAQRIRAWIEAGHLVPGTELPAERILAHQLGIARGTVRSALEELTRDGVLTTGPGSRRRIAGPVLPLLDGAILLVAGGGFPPNPRTLPSQDPWVRLAANERLAALGHSVLVTDAALVAARWPQFRAAGVSRILAMYELGEHPDHAAACVAWAASGCRVAAHAEPGTLPGCVLAASDQEAGGADLMRWLVARGCRRPLLMQRFPGEPPWLAARWRGARSAASAAGITPLLVATPALPAADDDYALIARLLAGFLVEPLAAGVDCILTPTDQHAWEVAAACRLLGRIPGRDVLIAGYDHSGPAHPHAHHARPGDLAVTIDKDLPALALTLVDLVLAADPPALTVVPHKLVALV